MWKISYFLFVFGVAANLKHAYAVTEEERLMLDSLMKPKVLACVEEFGLKDFSIEDIRKDHEIDPCLLQCFLKKAEVFVDGMINLEKADETLREVINDEDEVEQIMEKGKECADEANGSDVSGDDEDCARVAIFHSCLREKNGLFMATS
ncbi:uncharacterized protein LOC115442178 [Manduca sexta]|uniref:Uncharacterized protein n=1 Tax=Manduca sexta TaxID=7130 RepID=A0A922CAG0_MANSE|nr:uncharacterized protein LOC115442178 [Manduca sexta]KAG6440974.1 hypothetical protein O3G_MSEX001561 [Manduca sexta]KAG6440975.1 hypothetical protein O3G_MSEX001561 [Manduca sexta]